MKTRKVFYVTALVFIAGNIVARIADLRIKCLDPLPIDLLLAASLVGAAACLLRRHLCKYVLFLYAVSFPFYINHSWRIHGSIFEFLTAVLAACLLINGVRAATPRNRVNPVLAAFLPLFAGICLLSLQMLPVQELEKLLKWALIPSAVSIFSATPSDPLYAMAAVNRILLFFVFIMGLSSRGDYAENYRALFAGALFGGLWSSIVGLLEYSNLIDLGWLRETLKSGIRLQSVSGNAGWFAEYLTMTIPYILFGFLSRRGWKFKCVLFGLMILFEITIILTGARGGWLAYPATLLCCWMFFYLSKAEASRGSLRKRIITVAKIGVSVPLTLALSLLLVMFVFNQIQKGYEAEFKQKAAKRPWTTRITEEHLLLNYKLYGLGWRYKNLFEPTGRMQIAKEGIALWRERPVFGMGWETYRWHTGTMEQIPDSLFAKNRQLDVQLDTPHNFYIQLLAGVGVAGLIIWMLAVAFAFIVGAINCFRHRVLTTVPVLLALYSFHQYGLTQDPPYIGPIWLLGFLNLGYIMALPVENIPKRVQGFFTWAAWGCCLLVMAAGIAYAGAFSSRDLARKYGLRAYAISEDAEQYIGFYSPEQWDAGEVRWAGKSSEVKLSGQGLFKLVYYVPPIRDRKGPMVVYFKTDGRTTMARDSGLHSGWRTRYVYAGGVRDEHSLDIESNRIWSPKAKDINDDIRLLSIGVLTPVEPFGLTGQEALAGLDALEKVWEIPGWPEGVQPMSRWIAESCAVRLAPEVTNIYLSSGHPDPGRYPIRAYISVNGERPVVYSFKTNDWIRFDVGQAGAEDRILTVNLDRTWNPSREGISEDYRELGLRVAIPWQ